MSEDGLKTADRALVLGGLGYIGQEVSKRLLAGGFRVTVLDSRLHGQEPDPSLAADPAFRCITDTVADPALVETLAGDADVIIVLAALVGEGACSRDPSGAVLVNLLAPLTVREAALYHGRAKRLVFASTDSCYGKRPGETLFESSPLKPCSHYAELKARAEGRLLAGPGWGFPKTVILRLATVYGLAPRMRFDLAVNALTRDAAVKKRLNVFSGEQWRPLVHVRDVAEAFHLACTAPLRLVAGEVFNVGSNSQNIQFRDLGELIVSRCPGAELKLTPGEPDLRDYRVDFTKIRETLGFEPRVALADGIDEIRDALWAGRFPDPYSPVYRNA